MAAAMEIRDLRLGWSRFSLAAGKVRGGDTPPIASSEGPHGEQSRSFGQARLVILKVS
jgi:hypothetical protein